jgi:nicotinate-nucleotide adenylyltransferase
MRLGLMGGTFDPPHRAHVALAHAAREALDLDAVIVVPAGDPWRKAERDVTAAPVRLQLVAAAFDDLEWVAISDIEVRREGPSYTADTLAELQAEQQGHDWWFILGQDALVDLQHWHEPARIVALARLAVATRGDLEATKIAAVTAVPELRDRIDEVPFEPMDVSATAIRAQVLAGQVSPDLPDRVRALVDELGLYRNPAK